MRVCILGYSLSSLTLAKALVNQKINVDLFAQNKSIKINNTRTIGISKKNLEFFKKNIINLDRNVWKLNRIEIFSDNLKGEKLLDFENNNSYLFSIIKNIELNEKLKKSLLNNKYFLKKNNDLSKVKFENYYLIINTDYNNFLTKKFFNKKIIKKYNSVACSTIIKHEKISNNVAVQIFTKNGPLAFLPMSNNETSIVYSVKKSTDTSRGNINKLIEHYNFKYKIKKINKIQTFLLNGSSLRSYCYKNILAFGDLLHKIHPLAGQGFNMTIRDINILMEIIKSRLNLGLPIDSSVAYEFEKKFKHKNFIFLSGIDLVYEFFNLERKSQKSFLSKSVQILGKNSSLNKIFINIADKGTLL